MSHTAKDLVIPPELPGILKQYAKDAIRTQPEDLVEWGTQYFSALVQDQALPVREPAPRPLTPNMDLTPDILTAMHDKLQKKGSVSKKELGHLWRSFGLPEDLLKHILTVGCFSDTLDWIKFFALGCSYLGGTIRNAMKHALCILNSDSTCNPDACIPFEMFHFLYSYLAEVDGEVSKAQVNHALAHLETQAKASNGMVKVSDFIKVRLG